MPENVGSVIEPTGGSINGPVIAPNGKPPATPDSATARANPGGNKRPEPEIIFGIETETPVIERIESGTRKDGKPDGRRTRWERSRTAPAKETPIQGDLKKISLPDLVWGVHDMLATMTAIREVRLDGDKPGDESKRIADALQGVAEHYSIPVSAKQIALANLFTAMAVVYSPRFMAYRLRRGIERAVKPAMAPYAGPSVRTIRPVAVQTQEQPTPAPQGFTMPTPANSPEVNPTYVNVSPSELWTEPAADFPGVG